MNGSHRLVIAEDSIYWRKTLVELISSRLPDVKIEYEAADGQLLVEYLEKLNPDDTPHLALLDLTMSNMDGFQTARWLYQHRPDLKIIALSLAQDERSIIRLLRYNVMGFLHKNIDGDQLISAITAVRDGETYFSTFPEESGKTIRLNMDSVLRVREILNVWNSLSLQEQKLAALLCCEMSYEEISRQFPLSINSIQHMAGSIFKRFQTPGRIGLYLIAYKNKLF